MRMRNSPSPSSLSSCVHKMRCIHVVATSSKKNMPYVIEPCDNIAVDDVTPHNKICRVFFYPWHSQGGESNLQQSAYAIDLSPTECVCHKVVEAEIKIIANCLIIVKKKIKCPIITD